MDAASATTELDAWVAEASAAAANDNALAAVPQLISRLKQRTQAPDDWAYVASALIRGGLAAPAAALLDHALQRHPRHVVLTYLRGNAHRLSGRPADAERDLRAALALAPAHREAALSLAFLLREDGRIAAA